MSTVFAVNTEAEIENKALSLPETAKLLRIEDQRTYMAACEFLRGVAAVRKEIVEHHAPIKKAAFDAHRAACDAEARLLKPVTEAEQTVKRLIGGWEAEQRRLQEERERQAREEAERLAAEMIEAAAVEAEQQGATALEVAAIIEQPLVVPRIQVAPTYERATGIQTATLWCAEVTDIRALCRAVAEGKVSENYVSPNMTALNARARAEQKTMNIPGVRAVPKNNVRVGGR
jgi:hypothetical protein